MPAPLPATPPALQASSAALAAPLPIAVAPFVAPGRTRARVCAIAVLAIWISFILVARGSAKATLTPFDIAWLRFAFSGLIVLPVVWVYRQALVRGLTAGVDAAAAGPVALRRALALGLVCGVGYSLFAYSGFFLAPVAHAAVLLPGSLPLWSAIAALVLLGERLTAVRLLGLTLILLGGVAVAGTSLLDAFRGQGTWRGDLCFVAASITWALYGVLCRRWRLGALETTAAMALVSLVLFVPVYLAAVAAGWVPSRLGHAPWGELAFQEVYQGGLAMLVAGYAFTQVVSYYGPVRTTMFTAIVPPLAALAAVPVLDEPLAAAALVGLAFVTLGLLIGTGALALPRRGAGVGVGG